MSDNLELEARPGLPEHLRDLLKLFPRDSWETHPNFGALTRFWLDRHGMFRDLMTHLQTDARLMAAGAQQVLGKMRDGQGSKKSGGY